MDTADFYRGLLLGMRTHFGDDHPRFRAAGSVFHAAFLEAAQVALDQWPEGSERPRLFLRADPIFGTCRHADELLVEGEQDLLISLFNPRFEFAEFKIDKAQAQQELDQTGLVQPFAAAGRVLAERLRDETGTRGPDRAPEPAVRNVA